MDFKSKILPHVIAILAMVVLPMIYGSPILSGKILYQNDIIQGQGGSSEVRAYEEKTGEQPLWTNQTFSGMPTAQLGLIHYENIGHHIAYALRSFLNPIGIMSICMVSIYVLCVLLGLNSYVSLLCAIGFGFSTFNLVSIEAGHNSKIHALAYFPAVIGGVILAYRGKIWLGAGITALFLNLQLVSNHFQITYYLVFAILIYVGVSFYQSIKEKQFDSFIKASVILVVAAILAAGPNIGRLWTTYDYSKETIRGGNSELTKPEEDAKSSGLDKDYAFSWSYGVFESFTMIIPYFNGGASNEGLSRSSNLAKAGIPKQYLESIPTYWGDQPFTSGPVYLGAIFCFLFILSMFLLKGPIKWWIILFSALALILSWGKNFSIVGDFFFYYVPLFNKFRTPSMILGVLQITIPFAGALAVQKIIENKERTNLIKPLLISAATSLGIVFLFGILFSGMYDFEGVNDARLQSAGWPMDALKADRADLLRSDAIRSLLLIAIASALIYFYLKEKISQTIMLVGLLVFSLGDLWMVDKRYLNDSNFESSKKAENLKVPTTADLAVMEDKDQHYRVYNLTRSPFNDAVTSFHHKSIGGYHAGKLYRYQELIERQISNNNMSVLNMLNTKYFITPDKTSGTPRVQKNSGALGNAWLVDNIKWVANADSEMAALSDFNEAKTAIVDERFKTYLEGQNSIDIGNSEIKLFSYSPDKLIYKANIKPKEALAVFSEIYYEGGGHDWKARIDGQDVEHIRVNYLLRGLKIPQGEHEIEFSFEPRSWVVGYKLSLYSSFALVGFIGICGFLFYKKERDS